MHTGLYLKDITAISVNRTFLDDQKKMVNYQKFQLNAKCIRELLVRIL